MIKSKFKKLIAAISAAAMAATMAPMTIIHAAGTVNITPSEVTYIDAAQADTNFGSADQMYIHRAKITDKGKLATEGGNESTQVLLVKFDIASQIDDLETVKSVSLAGTTTWVSPPNEGKGMTVNIASTGTDWSKDTVTWNSAAEDLGTVSLIGEAGGGKEPTGVLSGDLTNSVVSDDDGVVSYALYITTARQQTLNEISLTVETADYTYVTVNYVDQADEKNILDTYTSEKVWSGDSYTVPEDKLGNITVGDKEYGIVDASNVTLTNVTADNNVLNLVYAEKQFVDLTVNYVVDGIGTIKSKGVRVEEGSDYTETELESISHEGTMYEFIGDNYSITNVQEGSVLELTYAVQDGAEYYNDNFDGLTEQILVKVDNRYNQQYEDDKYIMACKTRDDQDGAAFEIAFRNNQIEAAQTKYTDNDRYGRIYLKNTPSAVSGMYYASVDFMTNNASALVFSDVDTVALLGGDENTESVGVGTHNGIVADTWYTAVFEGSSSDMTLTIMERESGEVIYSAPTALTKFSRIDIRNGATYLDNIESRVLSSSEVLEIIAADYDLTDNNQNVVKDGNVYSVSGSFNVPMAFENYSNISVAWKVLEAPEDTDEWTASTGFVIGADGTVTIGTTSVDKDYKLVLTLTYPLQGREPTVKTVEYSVVPLTAEETVAQAVEMLKIPAGGDNDSQYAPTGNFTVDTEIGAANISWAAVDSTDDENVTTTGDKTQIVVNGSNIIVNPVQGKGGQVTLRATITCGSVSDTKDFILDLDSYLSTITTAVDNAADSDAVYPYDDQDGTYAMDVYAFSKFTAENPLSFDLYLPSTVAGVTDTHISQSWESSDEDHLAIDAANNKGAIGADDMEAHDVTLTKTVSYIKDGVTLASKEVEYTVPVQFDPDTLEDRVDAWAAAYAATQDAESTTSDKYTTAYNQVYNAFMRQYQLRLDAAYEGNFSNMPEEGTNISTSGISDLNYEGFFGSSIEWTSSQSTYASVSQSNRRVTVNRSSFSGTRDISITATLYLPSYTETETRAFSYEITGTRSTGNGGSPSGSVSNPGGGITVPIVTPTATPTATRTPASEAFDDIKGVESWAGDAIRALYDEGIISGKGDNKFAPYDNVTRGEFAKMIVGAFDLNEMPDEYRGFTDVPSGNWCFTYVEIAAAAGVVNGYDDGSFGLNDYITRQDMAVMVVRAAEAAGVTITDNGNSADFGDADSIADYAASAVDSLVRAGIINGIDGNFEPVSNANRAQAAKILANFIG